MTELRKYPRTRHVPWSRSKTEDDKVHLNMESFHGETVVVSVKMDGENCSMYSNHIHARSVDSQNHPSRNWVKSLHGQIAHSIPEGMIICGENMYAKHSIAYKDLPSYFLVFNIWEKDICLSWDETTEWCQLLGIDHVPVIYRGIYDENLIKSLWDESMSDSIEGYVIRHDGRFHRSDFSNKVGKFVRSNHVQSDKHWMFKEIEPNRLKE